MTTPSKQRYIIRGPDRVRDIMRTVFHLVSQMAQHGAVEVLVSYYDENRTLSQNKKLWPMLTDVSKQCEMVIDGELVMAQPDDWKDVFTAALRKHQRMAKGIDGGVVFLGARTSRMKKKEFCELIEIMYAYGAEHDVKWSEPPPAEYLTYREAA